MYLDAAIGGSCPNGNRTMPTGSTMPAGIYNDSSDGTGAPVLEADSLNCVRICGYDIAGLRVRKMKAAIRFNCLTICINGKKCLLLHCFY